MTIAVDAGSVTNKTWTNSTASGSFNFSNSAAGQIIIAATFMFRNAAGSVTVSSVTASGLTFVRRAVKQTAQDNVATTSIDVYWAYAPAQLTSLAFAVATSIACEGNCVVFGVDGCDPTAPWDVNGTLPGTYGNITGTAATAQITGLSTASPDSLMLGYAMSNTAFGTSVYNSGAGYSLVKQTTYNTNKNTIIQKKLFSSAQSSVTQSLTTNCARTAFIADALRPPQRKRKPILNIIT